jgi:hypothetical protein
MRVNSASMAAVLIASFAALVLATAPFRFVSGAAAGWHADRLTAMTAKASKSVSAVLFIGTLLCSSDWKSKTAYASYSCFSKKLDKTG